MKKDVNQYLLICPRNDEESLMIARIAEKAKIPTLISSQPHGAKLAKESDLLGRIQDVNPEAGTLVIVEIPGVAVEDELKGLGYEIVIIDHHRYDDLNRMKPQSSLEQFLAYFEITDTELEKFGFDLVLVQGVAAMDRGFIWELRKTLPETEWKRAIDFYRALSKELNRSQREEEERVAEEVWNEREERDGIIIIRSEEDRISIRDALSYLIAETYNRPMPAIITQGTRRIYAQETDAALRLQETFGGFTFGGDRCWGVLKEDGEGVPSVEEVLGVIRG